MFYYVPAYFDAQKFFYCTKLQNNVQNNVRNDFCCNGVSLGRNNSHLKIFLAQHSQKFNTFEFSISIYLVIVYLA